MGVIGTFGSFAAARLGIYASQAALNVTGNNIANINTTGYCRQSMDLVSLHSGGSDRYSNPASVNIGYGVLTKGVSQARDPYLDIRYRAENSNVGATEAKLDGLKELANVLDEVGMGVDGEGVLEASFNTIYEQMEILSRNVGSEEYDTMVRTSCETLCQLFNSYAKELNTIKGNQEASMEQDVSTVNTLLRNIQKLNEQIRNAGIYGDQALELRDQRNIFIDKLSAFIKIDVTYTTEPLDQWSSVEKLVISLADTKPAINLVDGIYATQLELPETVTVNVNGADTTLNNFVEGANDNQYLFQLAAMTDSRGHYMKDPFKNDITTTTLLDDTTIYGALQAQRELLTEEGEFASGFDLSLDSDANIKRGIPYYQKALDTLARKFAETMNKANKTDVTATINGINGFDTTTVTLEDGNDLGLPGGTYEFYKVADGCSLTGLELLKDLSILQNAPYTDTNPARTNEEIQQLQSVQLQHLHDFQHGYPTNADLPGGNLFSISSDSDDSEGITAANISVSKSWSVGDVRILTTKQTDANGNLLSTANENINHMITLMTGKMDYYATDISPDSDTTGRFFNGTFQEFFASVTNTLAADTKTASTLCENYSSTTLELDNDRLSVSGVDLNEEATSMMQFQKSYSAACRLLTTLDSMLERLINV